jgi:hypothetical protein
MAIPFCCRTPNGTNSFGWLKPGSFARSQERADSAVKAWLLAQIEKKRAWPDLDIATAAPGKPFAPERLAA